MCILGSSAKSAHSALANDSTSSKKILLPPLLLQPAMVSGVKGGGGRMQMDLLAFRNREDFLFHYPSSISMRFSREIHHPCESRNAEQSVFVKEA